MLVQYDSAIKYLILCFKKDTNYINALYYKAYSNYEKNEFDLALADANILIDKVPKDPDYLILRALIYLFNDSEYDDF
jgi:tetratricopeptide (TPR) repeat protein